MMVGTIAFYLKKNAWYYQLKTERGRPPVKDFNSDLALDLVGLADHYTIAGLRQLCENTLVRSLAIGEEESSFFFIFLLKKKKKEEEERRRKKKKKEEAGKNC